jgi:hypothetical protein
MPWTPCNVDSPDENCRLGSILHAFLPPTPLAHRNIAQLKNTGSRLHTPSPGPAKVTPVPSPTPFYHQLYAAVSYLEKEMLNIPQPRGRSLSADLGQATSVTPLLFCGRKSLDVNMKLAASAAVEPLDYVDTDMTEERNGSGASQEQPDGNQTASTIVHHHTHHANSASDTESDASDAGKHDELPPDELDDEPEQTPYMENDEEEFGSVMSSSAYMLGKYCNCCPSTGRRTSGGTGRGK